MNARLLEILQHSLGVDQYGRGNQYRNRFVTGPGGDDFEDCNALVAAGHMKDHGPQEMMGGMHYFEVTPAGIGAMHKDSPEPPKVSRGHERYRAFLRADCGMTFIEWLKASAKAQQEARY